MVHFGGWFFGILCYQSDPASRLLIAFLTLFGVFHSNSLPFGLTNRPPKYSKLVERVYGTLPRTGSFVDDTGMGHLDVNAIVPDLRQLFGRAREAN